MPGFSHVLIHFNPHHNSMKPGIMVPFHRRESWTSEKQQVAEPDSQLSIHNITFSTLESLVQQKKSEETV